ncbi:MAG: type II secretion system protein GspJ [Pseudomonadota bacterium]
MNNNLTNHDHRFTGVKGMTLIEVMVSIAVIALVMLVLASSSYQLMNTKERVGKYNRALQQMRSVLIKLDSDISSAFLIKDKATESKEMPTVTYFIGKDNGKTDEIRFTSFSHLRLFQGSKSSDQCQISYFIKPNEEDPGFYDLVRVEQPWLDSTSEVEGREYVVSQRIKTFDLEYYDPRKEEWVKEWNSESVDWKNILPHAVRVSISMVDPNDEEREINLKTAYLLPLSGIGFGI